MSDPLNAFCLCCQKMSVGVRYYAHYEREVVACDACGYVRELYPYELEKNVEVHNEGVDRVKKLLYPPSPFGLMPEQPGPEQPAYPSPLRRGRPPVLGKNWPAPGPRPLAPALRRRRRYTLWERLQILFRG